MIGHGSAGWFCGLVPTVLVVMLGAIPACRSESAGASVSEPGSPVVAAPPAATATRLRIGTYDSRGVTIAYARSEQFARSIGELHRRHDEAVAAGDTPLAEKLEREGQSQQKRLHMQGFSNAPVEDCMDLVRDGLPGVAEPLGVKPITAAADWHDPRAEIVDVTSELAGLFQPDAKTLQIITSVRLQGPMAIEAVVKMPRDD